MKSKYVIAILCAFVIIISSVGTYASLQVKEDNEKDEGLIVTDLKNGVFSAKLGIGKNEDPIYSLNGNYQKEDKIISCDGTVISGEQEGEFTGTFKGGKKSYFEITITIEGEPIDFKCTYKFEKNKDDFQGAWCNGGKEKCFDFVYPISYMMPDGTIITGNSEEEINQLIKDWYEAHPGEKEKPILQYPVDIKYKDGTIVTINNDEEMKAAYENCGDDKEWGWITGTFEGMQNSREKNMPNILVRFPLLARLLRMPIFQRILRII